MSIIKKAGKKNLYYDFWIGGYRFTGSTGTDRRSEALKIEKKRWAEAEQEVENAKIAKNAPLTLGAAILRYFEEIGQHNVAHKTVMRDLMRIGQFFGTGKLMADIRGDEARALKAWRMNQKARNRDTLVAAATVNRSTIEPLRKLFNAAKEWGHTFKAEPRWRDLMLPEPRERVRELYVEEEERLWEAVRDDYALVVAFALESGLRQNECLLRKDQVFLKSGMIRTIGKQRRVIEKRITTGMRAILMEAMANETDHVFTYTAQRTRNGRVKGQRYPITPAGLKTMWRRAKVAKYGGTLPADFRFHDLRHDFATKLLRETQNLKLVQKALGHSRLETTAKYAHVMDDEVVAGMERASAARASRRKSPTPASHPLTGTEDK